MSLGNPGDVRPVGEGVSEIRIDYGPDSRRAAMAKTQTRPWDPAEHLETDEDMAAYLNVALEEGDLGNL